MRTRIRAPLLAVLLASPHSRGALRGAPAAQHAHSPARACAPVALLSCARASPAVQHARTCMPTAQLGIDALGGPLQSAYQIVGGSDTGMVINNFGAVAQLSSFAMSDIFLLRILAVLGQLCSIYFYQTREPTLDNPTLWNLVFLSVNAVQIAKLLLEKAPVAMSDADADLYDRVFLRHGVTPRQYLRLLECSTRRFVGAGTVIQRECDGDECPVMDELQLIYSGGVTVRSNGTAVATWPTDEEPDIAATGFLGAVWFLERLAEEAASGRTDGARFATRASFMTIETTQASQLVVWDGAALRKLLASAPELALRVERVLTSSVVSKLEASLTSFKQQTDGKEEEPQRPPDDRRDVLPPPLSNPYTNLPEELQ